MWIPLSQLLRSLGRREALLRSICIGAEAVRAVEDNNGRSWGGRRIHVKMARPEPVLRRKPLEDVLDPCSTEFEGSTF